MARLQISTRAEAICDLTHDPVSLFGSRLHHAPCRGRIRLHRKPQRAATAIRRSSNPSRRRRTRVLSAKRAVQPIRARQPARSGPSARVQKRSTWVSQTGEDTSRRTRAELLYVDQNPGHHSRPLHFGRRSVYRTFDPVPRRLLCFRCHSTGPITLGAKLQVQPSEPGVRCESCHGPGRAHAESGGSAPIQNPKRLTPTQSMCSAGLAIAKPATSMTIATGATRGTCATSLRICTVPRASATATARSPA